MQAPPRLRIAFAALVLAASAVAQSPAPHAEAPAATAPAKGPMPPVHQPHPELPPLLALEHLRRGNLLYRQALARHELPALPPPRPAGAGRHVAAVIVCADADVDAPYLFSLLPRDTLVLSSPGPSCGAEEVALLERAVANERLSLIVLLTHAGCSSLAAGPAATAAQQALARRTAAARELAKARDLPLEQAAALCECEALLGASEALRRQVERGKLLLAPATVAPKTGTVDWLLTRAEQMPLPPAK